MKATVIKSTGSFYQLKTDQNTIIDARIRGKFKIQGIKNTNPVAVGDRVTYEEVDEIAIITGIDERKNYLIRKSVNLSKQTQIIASNIDLACFLYTLKEPETKLGFLDRFLITCEAYQIKPLIIFNKFDIYAEKEIKEVEYVEAIYHKIGYESIRVSSQTHLNIDALKVVLKDKIAMFFSHSGSGKSTLINTLQPDLNLKTGEISNFHYKGQHTTTFAQMFEWDFGGNIVDTPGVKEFGLIEMENEELQDYFPEIFAEKEHCKFYNCIHDNEPKCGVQKAVEEERISYERYKSYLNLLDN